MPSSTTPTHSERITRYQVQTDDGLNLCLRRVHATNRADKNSPPPAVMMLHGLAANHRTFHLPGRSLAEWLAARGYDVWLPELRGHGDSASHGSNWTLEDYLRLDLPAIIGAILAHTGHQKLHWVGHSMGGILLISYGLLHPDAPIDRAVALASALDLTPGDSQFTHLLKIRGLLERFQRIPYRRPMQRLAPAIGRGIPGLQGLHAWPSNIDGHILREIYASCFDDIPTSLLLSMTSLFEAGGLQLSDGFCFLKNARDFPFPLRILAGSRDRQVPAAAALHTAAKLGPRVEATVLGPDSPGDARTHDHYGHWDLLAGRRAPIEVWPRILQWLDQNPSPF